MRGPIQRNTVSLNRTGHLWPVLFSETVFLWIGPPFRRIGPFRKPNAPILTKHPVHLGESDLIHVRIWLVSSALESVEGRAWTALTTITCESGRWNTLLGASWYRVDSRSVTNDGLGMLLMFYQVSAFNSLVGR